MKFRIIALLVALPAVVVGLLAANPADASSPSHDAYMLSHTIAIKSDGTGKVAMSCHSGHTCKGRLQFAGATTGRYRDFSVPGHSTKYVAVAVHAPTDPAYPSAGTGGAHRTAATLNVHETSPRSAHYSYDVHTETLMTGQYIRGTIYAHPVGTMTKLKVELQRVLRGGSVETLHTRSVTEDTTDGGNTYAFREPLGANNSPSSPFQLRISGTDSDGHLRSWYWRGVSGATTGGSRYIRKATTIRAISSGPYIADFNYGSISGTIADSDGKPLPKAPITVAAPPPPGADSTTERELDIASCADIHGRTTTDSSGHYEEGFLPYVAGDKRYMVGAEDGSRETWNGNYGSCLDTIGYAAHTNSRLIDLGSGNANKSFKVEAGNTVKVDGYFSSKFSPTSQGDRWVTIREKIPGLHVLEDPIIAHTTASSSGDATFENIPPGQYLVEMGRRTGCADWQKSRFPNNDAYFKGLDRGSEGWKAFTKLSSLSGNSSSGQEYIARNVRPNHATSAEQGKVPSGYKGWTYRDFCKAYGAGTINSLTVTGFGDPNITKAISGDAQGAVVKGHVSRTGGRTNKEMMVRLSSSKQTLVVRADTTDSGGNFYIAGVASGTYTVSVNSDSWRGIGRTFSGHHTVTVKAGHGYNLGTLHFKG
jgi:hypothetical protein